MAWLFFNQSTNFDLNFYFYLINMVEIGNYMRVNAYK